MQVLEFVKSCFDGEAVVVKEVGVGKLAGRKMYRESFKPVMRRWEMSFSQTRGIIPCFVIRCFSLIRLAPADFLQARTNYLFPTIANPTLSRVSFSSSLSSLLSRFIAIVGNLYIKGHGEFLLSVFCYNYKFPSAI